MADIPLDASLTEAGIMVGELQELWRVDGALRLSSLHRYVRRLIPADVLTTQTRKSLALCQHLSVSISCRAKLG